MEFDDYHAHTNLSYCCEDCITPWEYVAAIRTGRQMRRAAITNHGFAIYFPKELAWSWKFMLDPSIFDECRGWGNERFLRHLDEVDSLRGRGLLSGVEVEMMSDGRLTVDPALIDRLDVVVGSVHWLPVSRHTGADPAEILDVWLAHTCQLLRTGIDVLGHPLRWLSAQIDHVPREITPHVVDLARQAGVAIEINAHYVVDTDAELLVEARKAAVPVTFCTDAHRPDEIGHFGYHRKLLDDLDLTLDDIRFWSPTRRKG
jgi:histidinol phosphatase-like PHP family hydrolase